MTEEATQPLRITDHDRPMVEAAQRLLASKSMVRADAERIVARIYGDRVLQLARRQA